MEQILQIPGAKTLRLQNHWKFSGFAGPIIIKIALEKIQLNNILVLMFLKLIQHLVLCCCYKHNEYYRKTS